MRFNEYKNSINTVNLNFNSDGRNYYVYRITNIKTNKHYYGSRVTKIEPYDDIGIKYLSSSSNKDFINEQKEIPTNFKYKVIRRFDNPGDSILYESYLHQYFNVNIDKNFINIALQTPTGFSGANDKSSILKRSNTLAKIDIKTGLTGYQIIGIKSKESNSKVNIMTGLTGYQKSGIKSKESNSKVNNMTGLTGYQTTGIRNKEILSKIDSGNGLTGYQSNGLKSKQILSKINPKTGLTGYQSNGLKSKETKSIIDITTGLSIVQEIAIKTSITLNTVQPSGLTRGQEIGIKTSNTLNTIQASGLTRGQEIGIKTSITLNTLQASGLTIAQEIGINHSGVNNYNFDGFYITPTGKYITSYSAELDIDMNACTIRKYCKNEIIITNMIYSRSKYLKLIGTKSEIVGKTTSDLGFSFEYH